MYSVEKICSQLLYYKCTRKMFLSELKQLHCIKQFVIFYGKNIKNLQYYVVILV